MIKTKRWYLLKARVDRDLTMDDVAKRMGCSRQMVCNTENLLANTRRGITIATAMKISKAYGIPFEQVCDEERKLLSC